MSREAVGEVLPNSTASLLVVRVEGNERPILIRNVEERAPVRVGTQLRLELADDGSVSSWRPTFGRSDDAISALLREGPEQIQPAPTAD